MKKLIASMMLILSLSNIAFADCDWSKGITKLPDGNYEYSLACHLAVGQMVQDDKIKDQQITKLTQAIQLKDLALVQADDRTQSWMNASDKLTDRMTKIDSDKKENEFIYFGLGILATIGTGFAIARLTK